LARFNEYKDELDGLGAQIIAASVDDAEMAAEVQVGLDFPVAYGITREQADSIGAWWEERRQIIQPSEFVLDSMGSVVHSTYSTGPIGRIDAPDVVKLIRFIESQKEKKS